MIKPRKEESKKKSNPDFFDICKKYNYCDFKLKHLKEAEKIYQLHTTKNGNLKFVASNYERKDHRFKNNVFTIDGEDAKDLDDAVSISKTKNSYILFVYIADVAHYIKEGSILDIEARKRGNSVYLLDNVIPMFPKLISNQLCSLNENKDRLTICVEMEISFSGKLIQSKIYHSLINISRCLTYKQVQNILDEGLENIDQEELNSLFDMKNLAENLYKRRIQSGSIDFNLIEIKFQLDKKSRPLRVYKEEKYFSHRIIEEFMLITNCVITTYLDENKVDLIYRIHESPDISSLVLLKHYLEKVGYKSKNKSFSSSKDFQRVLKEFKGDSKEEFFNMLLLRSMKKAIYAVNNLGHFGLSFKKYTHFTSPIRRYSDFVIHHLLKKVIIKNNKPIKSVKKRDFFFSLANHISFKERQSIEAEREIIKRKSAWYMQDKVGEIFSASIKGFTEYGIYVGLPSGIEGLVKKADLEDKFVYDEENYCYRSKNLHYEIGQNIRVKLISVDCQRFFINFTIYANN